MKKQMVKLKFILILSGFLLNSILAKTQSLVSSGGSFAENNNATVFWAVGEFTSETIKNEKATLTQGFYQPKFLPTRTIERMNLKYEIAVFPNPVNEALTLKCEKHENMVYQLISSSGAILVEEKITNPEIKIFVNRLPKGLYLLSIKEKNRIIENFKIEKY
ncbi:MAG: T9SS type A sorting domain-containing protein [Prolixibacteraceae bacterium]|nr:T9SS type A sorting domain-containing protein [Prolixibacteraceae bacterium]